MIGDKLKPITWTNKEESDLLKEYNKGNTVEQIAKKLQRTPSSVAKKLWHIKDKNGYIPVPVSTMPVFDQPLSSEGDALILSDIEAPFHHADFINRCLDLAYSWKIKTLHLNGDLIHLHNLSAWGAEWVPDSDESKLDAILEFMQSLPEKYKQSGVDVLEKVGSFGSGGGLSDELAEARRVFRSFTEFDDILVGIGNHDDRYLRALDKAINPHELLIQLERSNDKRWKIAPYYYTKLETEQGLFRIEHPRNAGRTAAQDLCAQFHTHVIMGHSHRWAVNRDVSGDFWAIQSGHCVDETRLAYVMQRAAKRDAHCLGAVIVRGGHPWALGEWSPWEQMKRM